MLYRNISALCLLLSIASFSQAQIHRRMKPFLGTWEYQGMPGFEVWKSNGKDLLGHSYRVKDGKDTVLIETMRVTLEGKMLVLYVTVLNQNNGKEIRFDESDKLKYKFVNERHDFPKSIYYNFKRFKRKKVQVLLNHPHKDTHTKPITMVRKK